MGCGSSKSTDAGAELAARDKGLVKKTPCKGHKQVNGKGSNLKNALRSKENSFQADLPGAVPENEPDNSMPPPVTFEIPATEDTSLIKKHPPKRLQKLEEQQITVTHERLAEKQMSAKERRQKLLQERVQSSRRSTSRSGYHTNSKGSAISEQMEHDKLQGESPNYTKDAEVNEF